MASSLFQELRRRNVFRVAAIYIVVGWLLMQVGDVMFPALRLPEWSTTLLVAFLILGFPVALIFAWAFELTPEGVVRTADVPVEQSITSATGQKINYLIIAGLAIAVAVLLVRDLLEPAGDPVASAQATDRSIAVLPFKNQSASEENAEFFSGGLHDELLMLLSRIGDLKVISRTSVERLDPQLGIPEIGEILGVATVLEGQVQRAGDRLRVTVQLIDAAGQDHIWANTYDSQLTAENVFEVQGDIARTIASALRAELSPREEQVLESIGTDNLEALDAYLLGAQIAKRQTYESLDEARRYLAKATELDPEYAEAWAELADVLTDQAFTGAITPDEYLSAAGEAVRRAIELGPDLPLAHAQLAFLKWQENDVAVAEASFRKALQLNPSDPRSLEGYGLFLRMTARPEEAIPVLQRAREVDPLSTEILFQIGKAEMTAGRPERFAELAKRIVEIEPASIQGYLGGLQANLWRGRFDLAWPWYVKALEVDEGDYENWAFAAGYSQLVGLAEAADRYLEHAEAIGAGEPAVVMNRILVLTMRGEDMLAYETATAALEAGISERWGSDQVLLRAVGDRALETGNYDEALRWYRQLRPGLFATPPQVDQGSYHIVADLAYLLQQAGQDDSATRLLATALQWYEDHIPDGAYGFEYGIIKAKYLAVSGRADDALAELQRAAASGWRIHWRYNLGGAIFDAVRERPEFQQIVADFEADMAAQLEAVRALPPMGEADLRDR